MSSVCFHIFLHYSRPGWNLCYCHAGPPRRMPKHQSAELGTFRRDLGCGNTFKLNSGAQNGCSGAQFQTPKSFRCGLGAGRRSRANAQRQSVNIYSRFSSEYFHLNKKSNIRNSLASSAGNSVCLSTGALCSAWAGRWVTR